MKLLLRRHETTETLQYVLADTITLHDLRRLINSSTPLSVHLSLNRKDELVAPSPEFTLRSLGVASGDIIYYSLDHSAFVSSESASSSESHQALVSDVHVNIQDQSKAGPSSGGSNGESSGMNDPEPMDIAKLDVELAATGSKRLSEPFFLKNILLEKSGDPSELTILATSVHAAMLDSGFVLFHHHVCKKISFTKKFLSVSLRYTLPELITVKNNNRIESVTLMFQRLNHVVVVYGALRGSSRIHRLSLDKRRFVPVINFVMYTLKSEKEGSLSIYRKVLMFWRKVKDGLVTQLLIELCDKAGLESPPCLMRLPTELKLKILESLTGKSVAKMACVCREMRHVASDNSLWKQKCLEEAKRLVVDGLGDSVNWKEKLADYWRKLRPRCNYRGRLPNMVHDVFGFRYLQINPLG